MSTPQPRDPPTFFTDRDLGRLAFPDGLRAAGLSVVTIFELYGVEESESVADDEWLPETARRGWPVLCCDSEHRKRRRPAERAALLDSGVREFVLNGNVPATENVARVLHNLAAMCPRAADPDRSSTASTRPGSNASISAAEPVSAQGSPRDPGGEAGTPVDRGDGLLGRGYGAAQTLCTARRPRPGSP